MKLLKVTQQGLIDITNTDEINYNRAEIMREGWRLKKEGHIDGLAQAWDKAKRQMKNMQELIAETELERTDYIETYNMAIEVAGELLEDEENIENEAMKDALYDFKRLMKVIEELGLLEEEKKLDKIYEELEQEQKRKSFAEIQKERFKKLFGEVA